VPFRVSTVETIDGIDRELSSLIIDHVGDYSLDFVPHGGTVNVVWTKAVSSPPTVTLTVSGLHFGHWTYEPGEVYVQICNSRDPYEFGFNGQMKSNEIAGVGNHNTALFWEYDTRLGRRWNLDPKSVPSESGYATLGNNPIFNIDRLGDVIAPWWLKSGPGDKIPGYGGGVQSPYKSFLPGEHENNPSEKLDDFNRTAIGLYTSNSIFKKTVDMLRASKTVYHVQQRFETDQNGVNAQYSPTTKTIEFKFFGISKEELFEETFHAGQDDYYSARGIKRSGLADEVEAKVANIISGYHDASTKGEYRSIQKYFKTGVKDKSFDKELNTVIKDTYDLYSQTKGENWAKQNDPSTVDRGTVLKYLESTTDVSNNKK